MFAGVDWPILMCKQMVIALAESAREYGTTLIVMNRPLCPFSAILRRPNRLQEFLSAPKLKKLSDNLYLFTPRYVIHDRVAGRIGFLEKMNLATLRRSYAYVCRRIGIREESPLVWYFYPQQHYVSELFQNSRTVYEMKDNLADIEGRELTDQIRLQSEARSRVDFLVTTSRLLHEKYSPGYRKAIEFRNGLDRKTYLRLIADDPEPIEVIEKIARPRIGFAGVVSQRLDWELIRKIAADRPGWNFVFVGPTPVESIVDSMATSRNIHFTGAFDHSMIPSILKSFDIGIMPYFDNDFFRYSNPLKFYEYAAAGIRTVSSDMKELETFPRELIRIVPNIASEWIGAIESMLASDADEAKRIGQELAGKFIWEDLTLQLLKEITAVME
jgi:hypothetical protein